MKKFLFLLALLPFVSFGGIYLDGLYTSILGLRVYHYTSSTNVFYDTVNWVGTTDSAYQYYASTTFGFSMYRGNLEHPSATTSTNDFGSSYSLDYQVRFNGFTTSQIFSPRSISKVDSLYVLAASLVSQGYVSSGLKLMETRGNRTYWNFNYKEVVSDILTSTNAVYRQILLSHLNSIQASVASIDSGVSSLFPEVSNIRSVNTAILTNVQSSAASLGSIDEAVDLLVDRVDDVLHKINSNPYVSDFTNAVLALADINGSFTPSRIDYLLSTYADLDSPMSRALFALSIQEEVDTRTSAEEFIKTAAGMPSELVTIGQYLSQDVVDALVGDYSDTPTRRGKAVNTRTSIKAQLRSWRDEAKKQLQDWQDDLRQQLQDWKTSDETGYLNVRGGIDNVTSNQYRYFDNNSPNSVFNFVVGNLTNAADRISRDSSAAITNSIRNLLEDLYNPDRQVSVRLDYPIRYRTTDELNVHDEAVYNAIEAWAASLSGIPAQFRDMFEQLDFNVRTKGTNYVDLSEWLEEWRRWVGQDTFYELAQSFYDFKTNALPFFADYNYSFNEELNFYQSAFDIVRNSSHSNVLSRLCFYGLSSDPDKGNFFNLFTSFVLLQSEIASSLLDAKDMIDDLSSSSSWFDGLSVFSAGKKVVDSIPSRSQIEQMVETASDGTNLVISSSTELLDSFGLMTNLHSHAFSIFKSSSSSLPDHIVLFRFKTSLGDSGSSYRDVFIPVGTVPNLWLVIRLSIAFGICAVNMILFPKFLLKLALLFMPLFKKSLSFLNASA